MADSFRYEAVQYIRANTETVWRWLTEPPMVDIWHLCHLAAFEGRVGGCMVFTVKDIPTISGEVTTYEPCLRLAHTFRLHSRPEEPETRVEIELSQIDNLCRLRLTHGGFPSVNRTYHDIAACWPVMLSGLQDVLEGGQTSAA